MKVMKNILSKSWDRVGMVVITGITMFCVTFYGNVILFITLFLICVIAQFYLKFVEIAENYRINTKINYQRYLNEKRFKEENDNE